MKNSWKKKTWCWVENTVQKLSAKLQGKKIEKD